MNLTCESIAEIAKGFSLVKDCTVLTNGTLRLATPFRYPNGSLIDLFIYSEPVLFPHHVISDLGQTAIYLRNLHIDLDSTKKRRQLLEDVCESLNIQKHNSQFIVTLDEGGPEAIPEKMVQLAQACIRISDLSFMQRFPMSSAFKDEVEEFIDTAGVEYEPDASLPGKYGRVVPVDFLVHGKLSSAVKTLSTRNPATAHDLMNEVLRCWIDLSEYAANNQLVTIIDDRDMPIKDRMYRKDDLSRIADFSSLLAFPSQRDQIKEILIAAA